jgi:lipopolysaccharide heptosyltransferase II
LKILILKPSSLGDVIQALPVLRLLKKHFPASRIYWWISKGLAPLLEADPDLAGTFCFDRNAWSRPSRWGEFLHSIHAMRQQRFDYVIDLQSLARSGAVAWLANGQVTIGLDDPREGAGAFHDISIPRPSFGTHAVDWYLQVLRCFNVPVQWDFTWLPAQVEAATRIRSRWPIDSARWVILNPGARWNNKRWPAERFGDVAVRMARSEPSIRFVVLGGTEDYPLGETIRAALPEKILNVAGKTNLREMIEWVRAGEVMVTNDTGPMHVAAALRKPIVGIFGPTEPRRTGPYGQMESVLRVPLPCSPCLKPVCSNPVPLECLHGINPDRVAAAALRAMSRQEVI